MRPPFRECSFLSALGGLAGELVGSDGYVKTWKILLIKKKKSMNNYDSTVGAL